MARSNEFMDYILNRLTEHNEQGQVSNNKPQLNKILILLYRLGSMPLFKH